MMKQIGITRWPSVVHNSFDCHWSTAFVAIKLEESPITLNGIRDSHVSLKWDFARCIRLQLVERAVLEQTKVKQVRPHINKFYHILAWFVSSTGINWSLIISCCLIGKKCQAWCWPAVRLQAGSRWNKSASGERRESKLALVSANFQFPPRKPQKK